MKEQTITISIAEMRAELAGEHLRRQRVHAKWVLAGTMTQADADRHTARFEAILDLLDREAAK